MRTTRWVTLALAVAVFAVPIAADEMQDAMARADALNLFRQIDLQRGQARQMIPPLQRIGRLVETHEQQRTQSLNRMESTLRQARQQLIAGAELGDEAESALEEYEERRASSQRDLYRSVDAEMQAIAEMLTPEQNELLDWTAPASIRPEQSMEQRLRVQQVAMGRIQEAERTLDRVKHLDAFNFVTGRGPMLNDYLAGYFQPEGPQFQEAYQMVLDYTDEVRMLREEEWEAQSREIAAAMVEDLGLMPTIDPEQRTGTVSWRTLYRLVTNPETLAVVRGMAR
ncbi:MAG: hypothetical protein ACLFU7_05615 [Armatimonadota bacterium]